MHPMRKKKRKPAQHAITRAVTYVQIDQGNQVKLDALASGQVRLFHPKGSEPVAPKGREDPYGLTPDEAGWGGGSCRSTNGILPESRWPTGTPGALALGVVSADYLGAASNPPCHHRRLSPIREM